MQADTTVELPPAPLKPTCHQIFNTGPCADSWRNYNQAVQEWNQQYVKSQRDSASSQATAPLQQQIADQRDKIKPHQEQMRPSATAAIQAKVAAHTEGVQQGAAIGVGSTLVLFGVIYSIKKFMGSFTVTKNEQARAAS